MVEQLFRWGHSGHGALVLYRAGLGLLEGGLADEDGLAMLHGLHGAHRETRPCSRPLHLVQNWHLWVPCRGHKGHSEPE